MLILATPLAGASGQSAVQGQRSDVESGASQQAHSARAPLLQAIAMTKRYGTFAANDAIDLDLLPAKSTRCSARTAPASRRWSKSCTA